MGGWVGGWPLPRARLNVPLRVVLYVHHREGFEDVLDNPTPVRLPFPSSCWCLPSSAWLGHERASSDHPLCFFLLLRLRRRRRLLLVPVLLLLVLAEVPGWVGGFGWVSWCGWEARSR